MFRSKDNGKTWVKEDIIRHPDAKGWLATTMACDQGVTLKYGEKKGRLLMAARVFVEYDNQGQYDQHYSTALYSDDHGKSWHPSAPFPFNGTGEANLTELSDGRIYYNSRSHTQYGNRLTAISYDGGETWTDGRKCNYLPDGPPDFYGCKGGMVRLPLDDYDILIYSQNDDPGGDSARHTQRGRENLTIWASFDGGETWPVRRHLHTTGGYSSLAAGRDGTPSEGMIYLLCHKGFFARFNLAWITEGRDWKQFVETSKK
jgi:sialidase-1